jgi:hypothetical protein
LIFDDKISTSKKHLGGPDSSQKILVRYSAAERFYIARVSMWFKAELMLLTVGFG